ncbi:MAG: acyltransferase family protein [Rhizomicrobium sp.]
MTDLLVLGEGRASSAPSANSASRSAHAAQRYRPDIDALRALAVLPVIWFHASLPGLAGGFAGVDVFYVISGFLITRIIMDRGFRPADFYERRARRLFPALFAVIAATTSAAWFILMPTDFVAFAKSAIAALTFTANLWFWKTTNYFAPGAFTMPLLHTWSLGVEEQFYLVYPALLFVARRLSGRWLAPVLIAAWAVSFAACVVCSTWRPELSFYWLPFRGWQLLTGAILSMLPAAPERWRWTLGTVGAILLGAGYVLIDNRAGTYPDASALAPVLGSALLIASHGAPFRALLTSAPLVGVGRISYSLYLWHWPVFALWEYRFEETPSVPVALALIVAVFVVSWLSWRFVEEPFRRRHWAPSRRGIAGLSVAGAVALTAFFVAGFATAGFPARFPAAIATFEREAADQSGACSFTTPAAMSLSRLCHLGAPGRPGVILWGDSIAWAMRGVFDRAMKADGIAGALASRGGCPPGEGVDGNYPLECSEVNRATLAMVRREKIGMVILVGGWGSYPPGHLWLLDGHPAGPGALYVGLARAVRDLKAAGVRVVLVDPVPGAKDNVPRLRSQRLAYGLERPLSLTTAEYRANNAAFFTFVAEHPKLGRVHLSEAYCNATLCPAILGGQSVYFDGKHPRLSSDLGLGVIERDLEVAKLAALGD